VAGLLANTSVCFGDIQLPGTSPDIYFKNVAPYFTYFGVPTINETLAVHLATESELRSFCSVDILGEIKDIFDFQQPTILMVDRNLDFGGDYCDWNFGVNSGDFLRGWCSISNSVILFLSDSNGSYPGISSNANFRTGTPFEMKETCKVFESRIEREDLEFFLTLRNKTMVHIASNVSKVERLNRWFIVQLLFRGVIPGSYICVFCLSVRFLYHRWKTNSLNMTQCQVLVLNIVICCIFGYLNFRGNNELTTNVYRGSCYFFYNLCIGCGLAGDLWISLMYGAINARNNASKMLVRRYSLLRSFGFVAISFDIVTGFGIVYGSHELRNSLVVWVSMALLFGQISISTFQIFQSRTIVSNIEKTTAQHSENLLLSAVANRLRLCLRLSVFASFISILSIVYHWYVKLPTHSPTEKYIFWSVANLARALGCGAQAYACSPVYKEKKVHAASRTKVNWSKHHE